MEDLTLLELKEGLDFLFKTKLVNEYNNSTLDTATRSFYEYESLMDAGLTEEIVCKLLIGQLLRKNGMRIFIGQYNLVMDAIEKAIQHENELDLTDEEKEEVINLARILKEDLPKMTIEYDPKKK